MTVCIQYSRPISGQENREVFGLDVAVNNLVSAYLRHGTQETFICSPTDIPSFDHFKVMAEAAGHDPQTKCIGLDPRQPRNNLTNIGCVFRPDPLTANIVWQRQQVSGAGYATCGLVHTMSGERIANAVYQLLMAPSDSTDALICPSASIRDAVRNLWQLQSEYINHRTGGKLHSPLQTPVIPLGVNTGRFEQLTLPDKRASQRRALNATDDEIIVLFLGRLSFATKAHPLPLWLAVERAAQRTNKKIRMVMLGYFKPSDMEPHFRNLAADIFKSANIDFIMNDDARFPDGLWAGADIFASLSDNIQESFGLTPIEAMASGLPAVISDWDGYRGSVRDGVDGFLIPTLMPPTSSGLAIAEAYMNEQNYGVSLSGTAQSTAIDIERCSEAILQLVDNPALRQTMGQSGKAHARAVYDWRHIIKAYENLWADLAAQRRTTARTMSIPANWQAANLSHPNPLAMFDSFPTRKFNLAEKIRIVMEKETISMILKHEMNYFVPELLIPKETMAELVEAIRKAGEPAVVDILATFPITQNERLLRCIGWMLKHGVAVIGNPNK